jgi:hypothetical protein
MHNYLQVKYTQVICNVYAIGKQVILILAHSSSLFLAKASVYEGSLKNVLDERAGNYNHEYKHMKLHTIARMCMYVLE